MWLLYALISAFFYGATNIVDSVLINNYEKRPVVYLFYGGLMTTLILAVVALFVEIRTEWMWYIIVGTMIGYIGDLYYFYVLGRIDVSVMNATWAILAIFMSIGGYVFFHEVWTTLQTTGAFLIITGIFLLSYWHKHVSVLLTVALFSVTALFFLPNLVMQKAALLSGVDVLRVTYWTIMGRNIPNILVPLFRAEWREGVISFPRRVPRDFVFVLLVATAVWFIGLYAGVQSFALGYVSLATIATNVQPFFVMFQAWLISLVLPRYTPRELLTAQSVQTKLISFIIVFFGLALLAIA